MFWLAVPRSNLPRLRIEFETELGCDDHLVADGCESFSDELFVGVRTVYFRRVEERDAAIKGGVHQVDHFLLIFWRAVVRAHAHAAESDC